MHNTQPPQSDQFFDRGLPQGIEAEMCILGAILLDNSVCAQAAELLRREDFFLDSHRRIFDKMLALFRKQWSIDPITLTDELRAAGEFEQIGGATSLTSLTDGVPRTDNIEYYAKIIIKKAMARALITASSQIVAMAFDEPDRDDLGTEAQRMIFKACEERNSEPWVTLGAASENYLKTIELISDRGDGMSGLITDLADLDHKLLGLQRKELIIVAGRPSQGKTSLAFDLTKRVAKKGKRCAFVSIEMDQEGIAEKGVASEARLNSWRMRSGNMGRDEWSRAGFVQTELQKLNVWICDQTPITTVQIRAKLQRLRNEQGPIDLIVVDYLGRVRLPRRHDKREELGDAASEMKDMAKEFDAPVLLLHQLSREPEKRKIPEPELSDLAESGYIEQHTDVALFIFREKNLTKLKIAKNRRGPTGIISLQYFKDQHRFENAAADGAGEPE